jgi:hypothetical protein
MKNITEIENGLIVKPKEGHEIDLEKSDLKEGKIVFKKIESKYPMRFGQITEKRLNNILHYTNDYFEDIDFLNDLLLFGQLVQTCQEWNKIDGFEPTIGKDMGTLVVRRSGIEANGGSWAVNKVLAFKDEKTAQLFLSTFKNELEQVKHLL